MGEKASWHGPVCPATQPTHLRGSLAAPETTSFLWAGTRIGIFFFFFFEKFLFNEMHWIWAVCYRHLRRQANKNCLESMVPPVVLSGVPSSVGSPAPGGLLLPYTKLPGSVLPRHSRGCLGSLNPRASSAFCSQPSYSLSHPFSPFFFKTIVCVPPSPPPAIVFVDDLTRSHQKPHTENQQRGMGGETNYE